MAEEMTATPEVFVPTEKVKKPEKIMNMEELKKAFFNKEYDEFNKLLKESELIIMSGDYKYFNDYDERPSFVANNFIKGVSQRLSKENTYLMCCFRCYKNGDNYIFPSMWLINTKVNMCYFGDIVNDYNLRQVDNIDQFVNDILKKNPELIDNVNLIGEHYVH